MLKKLLYVVRTLFLCGKYQIIKHLIGDMPVIANCTIYDDIFDYNFGKIKFVKPHMCFNNRIRKLDRVINEVIVRMETSDKNVKHVGNSFVFKI